MGSSAQIQELPGAGHLFLETGALGQTAALNPGHPWRGHHGVALRMDVVEEPLKAVPCGPANRTGGSRGDMTDRFSARVGNIAPEDLDILECLLRIDQAKPLDHRAGPLIERLIEAGLVDRLEVFALTTAGIDRCRSLQLRVASDHEAAQVLAARGLALAEHSSGDRQREDS